MDFAIQAFSRRSEKDQPESTYRFERLLSAKLAPQEHAKRL
jgi:hypothetical protein